MTPDPTHPLADAFRVCLESCRSNERFMRQYRAIAGSSETAAEFAETVGRMVFLPAVMLEMEDASEGARHG